MRTTRLAVVGGGPAGLSAAIAAGGVGVQTVLLDENSALGGQLRYRIAEVATGTDGVPLPAQTLLAQLREHVAQRGVDARAGSLAWGLFEDNILTVVDGTASYQLQAERIVLATGSTDLPFPFAGGSLPGVFSARAVQILLHVHRVRPGHRFVVLGAGAQATEVIEDIRLSGGEVVASFDPRGDAARVRAEGPDGITAVMLDGARQAADVVVIALGRQPDPALALMAECAAGFEGELGGFVPTHDDGLRTSDPRILVAGDCAGLCDVATALAEGRLAGLSAAASLGLLDDPSTLDEAHSAIAMAAPGRLSTFVSLTPTYVQG